MTTKQRLDSDMDQPIGGKIILLYPFFLLTFDLIRTLSIAHMASRGAYLSNISTLLWVNVQST